MKVRCKVCKNISNKKDWKIEYEDCELCGAHKVETCPVCKLEDEFLIEEVETNETI